MSDADPGEGISLSRAAHDLGFDPDSLSQLAAHLTQAGYLLESSLLRITPKGIDYIERLAWRRRSVRLASPELAPSRAELRK